MLQNAPEEHKQEEDEDKRHNLMDGATGQIDEISRYVDEQRRVAANPDCALEARLEAYEDIIDSEVGDTSMVRARNIEREMGLRQIYLKFEGGNPTGTQKDRIAFAQAMDALRRRFDTITVATCGNYGVAVALAASFAGLRCIIYIPSGYHTRRVSEMTALGAEIVREGADYERAVAASSERAEREDFYDANPRGPQHPAPAPGLWRHLLRDLRRAAGRPPGGGGARVQRHDPVGHLQGISQPLPPGKNLPDAQDRCRILIPQEPYRPGIHQKHAPVRGPEAGGDP